MWLQLLWKYSKSAVALRLRFLQQAEGVQARTAQVQVGSKVELKRQIYYKNWAAPLQCRGRVCVGHASLDTLGLIGDNMAVVAC